MSNEIHSPCDALDTIGNIAAWVRDNCGDVTNQTQKYMGDIIMFVNAALALPHRNCDIGTPDEQAKRFEEYCESECNRNRCKLRAKVLCIERCALEWAQMPYEEGADK